MLLCFCFIKPLLELRICEIFFFIFLLVTATASIKKLTILAQNLPRHLNVHKFMQLHNYWNCFLSASLSPSFPRSIQLLPTPTTSRNFSYFIASSACALTWVNEKLLPSEAARDSLSLSFQRITISIFAMTTSVPDEKTSFGGKNVETFLCFYQPSAEKTFRKLKLNWTERDPEREEKRRERRGRRKKN